MSGEPRCKTRYPDHFVPYPMGFAPLPLQSLNQNLVNFISEVNNQSGSRKFLVPVENYKWLGGVVPHHKIMLNYSRTKIMRMKLCDRKGLFTLLMKFERFDRNMCLGFLLMLLSTIIVEIFY